MGAPSTASLRKRGRHNKRERHEASGRLLYAIHELSRLISTRFDASVNTHRLTRAQWWGLMHINENQGVTQTELAAIMEMGRASTGRLLERLEEKGWIERRDDEADSRLRRVFLSKSSEPVLELMSAAGQDLFEGLLKNLNDEEIELLLAGLNKIKANAAGEPPTEL